MTRPPDLPFTLGGLLPYHPALDQDTILAMGRWAAVFADSRSRDEEWVPKIHAFDRDTIAVVAYRDTAAERAQQVLLAAHALRMACRPDAVMLMHDQFMSPNTGKDAPLPSEDPASVEAMGLVYARVSPGADLLLMSTVVPYGRDDDGRLRWLTDQALPWSESDLDTAFPIQGFLVAAVENWPARLPAPPHDERTLTQAGITIMSMRP